jgi:hypothetical protein
MSRAQQQFDPNTLRIMAIFARAMQQNSDPATQQVIAGIGAELLALLGEFYQIRVVETQHIAASFQQETSENARLRQENEALRVQLQQLQQQSPPSHQVIMQQHQTAMAFAATMHSQMFAAPSRVAAAMVSTVTTRAQQPALPVSVSQRGWTPWNSPFNAASASAFSDPSTSVAQTGNESTTSSSESNVATMSGST